MIVEEPELEIQNRFAAVRRWTTPLVVALVTLSAVILIIGLVTRAVVGDGPVADPLTGGTVKVAMLEIPVAAAVPGFDAGDRIVWQGEAAPTPSFNTAGLGPDLSFTPGRPPDNAAEGLQGDAVYLGDHDGVAMILFAEAAPLRNPWDHVYEFVAGHGDRRQRLHPAGRGRDPGPVQPAAVPGRR